MTSARVATGNLFYRRFLSRITEMVALGVMTGIVVGTLLLGGFYAAYCMLVEHGVSMDFAFLIVGAAALVVAGMLILLIRRRMSRHKSMIPAELEPLASSINHIAQAFMEGLSGKNPPPV